MRWRVRTGTQVDSPVGTSNRRSPMTIPTTNPLPTLIHAIRRS
jgi:hypothetical protein